VEAQTRQLAKAGCRKAFRKRCGVGTLRQAVAL
jgi:hypothetical protein